LADLDLKKFLDTLASKPLIFHGADYDLRMMRNSFGFRPANDVFDTMIAAQLLGYKNIGLASLVESLFGIPMSKHGQKFNWAQRPLPQDLLEYASYDTKYLEQICQILIEKLRQLDRFDWYIESCQGLVKATATDRFRDPDDAWRINGTGRMTPQQLEFVRQIWLWRQDEAQKADVPPFKVMVNSKIIDLAFWATSNHQLNLNEIPKLPKNCKNSRLQALKDAIQKAAMIPRSDWPQHRKRRGSYKFDHISNQIFEQLKLECIKLAEEFQVDASILAPRATLLALAKNHSKTFEQIVQGGAMMPWQAKLFVPALKKILAK
jgi:ribonuclease D